MILVEVIKGKTKRDGNRNAKKQRDKEDAIRPTLIVGVRSGSKKAPEG